MDEMGDDFGDLYADVEVQVSAAINAIPSLSCLNTEQENENSKGSSKEGPCFRKIDSINDELTLDSEANKENGKNFNADSEKSISKPHCERELVADYGSDSEDDFHIVLNDEDCRVYRVPLASNARNAQIVERNDDEDNDLVIVTENDGSNKDRIWVDQLQPPGNGIEQAPGGSGVERGLGMKNGYHSQYSQYKYIRPFGISFPSNTKVSGSMGAASFSSPFSGKVDLDMNRCNQYMGSSSGHVGSSRTTASHTVAQSGYDFLLPRYRTILDVSIETFEQKPWRNPGVDITDYFNFGLDEESWKHYCNCLEQFRQANMLSKSPVFESSKPIQACQSDFEYESAAQEAATEKIGLTGQAESVSISLKNADKGLRQLEIPKGKAIQVEGGNGERRPSMDIRRPRSRDSDVVIQIAVQDCMQDSSVSGKEEMGNIDNTVHEASEDGEFSTHNNKDRHCFISFYGDNQSVEPMDVESKEIGGGEGVTSETLDMSSVKSLAVCKLTRRSRQKGGNEGISDVDGYLSQKVEKNDFEANSEELGTTKYTNEVVCKIFSNAEPCQLDMESSLGGCIQRGSSPSNIDSQSDAYRAGFGINPEDVQNPERRASQNSFSERRESSTSDYDYCKDNDSSDDKSKTRDVKHRSSQSPIQEERNCHQRMRLRSAARFHIDKNEILPTSKGKSKHSRDHLKVKSGRGKEDQYDNEDLPYHKETDISYSYHGRRFSDKQEKNAHTETLHRKGHLHVMEETCPYIRRHTNEREYSLEQDITKGNDRKQREGQLYERRSSSKGVGGLAYKENSHSVSQHPSLYLEKERYIRQGRIRENGTRVRRRSRDEDFVLEHRLREDIIAEKNGKSAKYNQEGEIFEGRYERHVYDGRKVRASSRRERYSHSPSLDLYNSWRFIGDDDGDYERHTDHHSLLSLTYREPHVANGKGWHDITYPRTDAYESRRLSDRYGGHRRQIHSKGYRESDWCSLDYKDDYKVEDYAVYPDLAHNEKRRFCFQSRTLHYSEDEYDSRHRSVDDLYSEKAFFLYERRSRHEHIPVKHEPTRSEMLFDDDQLEWNRRKIRSENINFEFDDCISSSLDIIHRSKHQQAALTCRDSFDLHLVGGEGKCSGRYSEAGGVRCNGWGGSAEQTVDTGQMNSRIPDVHYMGRTIVDDKRSDHASIMDSKIERIVQSNSAPVPSSDKNSENWLDKYPITQDHEALDLEEGQIAAEESEKKEVGPVGDKRASQSTNPIGGMQDRRLNPEDAGHENKVGGGYENQRILETLAKMERRRERFKEPITLKKELETNSKPQPDTVDTVFKAFEFKQQRPARKRRWGGT